MSRHTLDFLLVAGAEASWVCKSALAAHTCSYLSSNSQINFESESLTFHG